MSTTANTYREILRYAVPLMVTILCYCAVGLTDTWFMGQVGTREQAGLAVGSTVALTIAFGLWGILSVVESFVSQHFGASLENRTNGKLRECGQCRREALLIGAGCGVIALASILLVPSLTRLFGATPDIADTATTYASIRLVGVAFTCIAEIFKSFLRAVGRPRTPMVLAIATVLLNIPLNAWFVFGGLGVPAMGAQGAAIATILLCMLELVVLIAVDIRVPTLGRFSRLIGPISPERLIKQLRVGLPLGISSLMSYAGMLAFWAILSRLGAEALGAHAITMQLTTLFLQPTVAIGGATAILVAQSLGAQRRDAAWQTARAGMRMAIGYAVFVAIALILLCHPLASMLTHDSRVVALASTLLLWTIPYHASEAVSQVSNGVLRGAGDTRWMMWIATFQPWFLLVPLAWLAIVHVGAGIAGGWAATVAAAAVCAVFVYRRVRQGAWMSRSLLDDSDRTRSHAANDALQPGRFQPVQAEAAA